MPQAVIKCECNICEGNQNNTCITDGLCYTEVTKKDDEIHYTYSCLNQHQYLPPQDVPFFCRTGSNQDVECCSSHDYCNRDLVPQLPPPDVRHIPTFGGHEIALVTICPFVVLVAAFLFVYCVWQKKREIDIRPISWPDIEANYENRMPLMKKSMDSSIEDLKNATTSGSGSGLPVLMQRSVARQIYLLDCVGKGRYGEVWKGVWNSSTVAVKVFPSRDEKSWTREVNMYETVMLRHENILGFIAADNKDNGTWTQLWIITDYHPNGSLFDYLSFNKIDSTTMFKMVYSIACGLAHLHMEIIGVQGKPAIAHRDLKSKNILVKENGTCAIGDLGLAIRYYSTSGTVDIAPNPGVGTVRYLAPEVLDGTINLDQFESCKRADVYAYGLVLWEIARRCSIDGIYEEYQLPYYDMVPSDPTIEEMKKVVCDAKQRPPVPNRWHSIENLRMLSKIMKECWYQNAAARLTALRIKKTIATLGAQRDLKI